ncbi:MAG: FAD:protein FMN transferase, partial [Actinomycetes bacterium]
VADPRTGDDDPVGQALARAAAVFARVETACTRFDPTSPLMQANARPRSWHPVPDECAQAIAAAAHAYRATGGLFDPRILRRLETLGYDRSLPFRDGMPVLPGTGTGTGDRSSPVARRPFAPRWRTDADGRTWVRIGAHPIDLGGIGKGLAVRWAAEELTGIGRGALVEAGGDIYAAGAGPDGTGWMVGVEDPRGGALPVAVLRLVDRAVTTSSIAVRRWSVAGRAAHHLIDPRTGQPGGQGLLAVTVAETDPATSEVWSKSLFLAGRRGIRSLAASTGLAALWVDTAGVLGTSPAMRELLAWQAPR